MTINECSMDKPGLLFDLKKGLDAEYQAKEACKNLLVLLEDAEDQAKINSIITDEEKHIKIAEHLIKIVEERYIK